MCPLEIPGVKIKADLVDRTLVTCRTGSDDASTAKQ
jgi:hypothetical protein